MACTIPIYRILALCAMGSLQHKSEPQEVVNISWLFSMEGQEAQTMLH